MVRCRGTRRWQPLRSAFAQNLNEHHAGTARRRGFLWFSYLRTVEQNRHPEPLMDEFDYKSYRFSLYKLAENLAAGTRVAAR